MRLPHVCLCLLICSFATSVAEARTMTADADIRSTCDAVSREVWQSAEAGNEDAQVMAGYAIVAGECTTSKQVLNKGLRWLHGAAENDHLGAVVSLAMAYHMGDVINADLDKAITYYRQAAEAEIVDAQHTLGILLVSYGTTDTRDEGMFWLGAAASQGDGVSAAFLGMLHDKGLHGVDTDGCQALDWYEASLLLEAPLPVETFISELPDIVRANC